MLLDPSATVFGYSSRYIKTIPNKLRLLRTMYILLNYESMYWLLTYSLGNVLWNYMLFYACLFMRIAK